MPDWLMGQLGLGDGDPVRVTRARLRRGSFATFALHCEVDLGDVDLGRALENSLVRFACLTLNDALEIAVSGVRTVLVVKALKPPGAVSIIDLNLTIDFEMAERPFTERRGIPDVLYKVAGALVVLATRQRIHELNATVYHFCDRKLT